MSGELSEALQAVIRTVDRLRDEVLPDICVRLREIESSPTLARGQKAAPGPPKVRAHQHEDPRSTPEGPRKKEEASRTRGDPAGGGELWQAVAGLHDRLEARMQRLYEEHAARWREELEGLLHHVELARPAAPTKPPWDGGPEASPRPSMCDSQSVGDGHSPFLGAWRDPSGTFLKGRTIEIAEDGWSLPDAARPAHAAGADPVEFITPSMARLLLPPEEGSPDGSPHYVTLDLGPDDTVAVNDMGNLSCTLQRVSRRPSSSAAPDGQSALNTVYKRSDSRNLSRSRSGRLQLLNKTSGKFAFFRSRSYEGVQVVMIVLDAFFISWRTQRAAGVLSSEPQASAAAGISDSLALVLINDVFCLWYIVDLVGRGLSQGRLFCEGAGSALHCFEVFVVAAYLLEVIAVHADYDEAYMSSRRFWVELVSLARTLRLLRLVNMSSFVRHNTAFRELRLMMYALQGALLSLVWSTVMLVVILLITGTVFTNGYIRHVIHNGHVRNPDLRELELAFGTLSESMFTLGKAVTGGVDWGEVYMLLEPLHWPYKCLYVCFQLFATLALLNVITAVFVESTMQRSGKDRESAVVEEITGRKELLARIDALFDEFDEDEDGQITKEELKVHMQKQHIAAYFSSLGVDVDQVGKLFLLLDQDHSGFIDRQEFLQGCLRLKGEAKSVDLAVLQADVDLVVRDVHKNYEVLHACLGRLEALSSTHEAVNSI